MPVDIKQRNHVVIAIEATTEVAESEAIELLAERDYTIIASTLGASELVTVQVYDYTKEAYQPMKVGGDTVFMTQDYEILTFSRVSAVIKLNKTLTSQSVGVTVISR